jgi:hypothetical protein
MHKPKPRSLDAPLPLYASPEQWCEISGMRLSATYAALRDGSLPAKKCGGRTMIHVRRGLTYLESLPDYAPSKARGPRSKTKSVG